MNTEALYLVQVGRGSKGGYETRFSFTANQVLGYRMAVLHYNCINTGNGYKKRLIKIEDGKQTLIDRYAS